jgi:hypothetical protein
MPLNIESLSNIAKAELLARIAHRLTVVARDTYEVGRFYVLRTNCSIASPEPSRTPYLVESATRCSPFSK